MLTPVDEVMLSDSIVDVTQEVRKDTASRSTIGTSLVFFLSRNRFDIICVN